jgi:hypothetical protein
MTNASLMFLRGQIEQKLQPAFASRGAEAIQVEGSA